MHIFNRGGKVNFIDKLNLLVGFDMELSCSERFGWGFMTSLDGLRGVGDVKDMSSEIPDFEDYVFVDGMPIDITLKGDAEAKAVAFEVILLDTWGDYGENSKAWLVLVNSHNGFYTHGFEVFKPTLIKEGGL